MATKQIDDRSARQRLLDAASELFYDEGVNTVGIDRVIERAGVAKATLYSTFGSKDELIRAYLGQRHETRMRRIEAMLARHREPREQLLGIFDVLADLAALPGYRGCAFLNASAEAKAGSTVQRISDEYRGWLRDLIVDLSRKAGAKKPDHLAQQIVLLYDGATVGAHMDHNPKAAATARAIAATLIDASI